MSDAVVLPTVHDLKIDAKHFRDVYDGAKRAEIRRNDRAFCTGDVLVLREWLPTVRDPKYTGRLVVARVTHILADFDALGLAEGFVSLSIEVVAVDGKGA